MPDLAQLRELGDRLVPPPLDSLRETAHVRDRRTRTATVGAAAAAVAGVASFAFLGGLRDERSAPEPVQPPEVVTTRPLTYADGVTVHYGDQTVIAAGPVKELDVTDAGVGFRTADGRVWFTDGSTPVELGSVGEPPAPIWDERPYAAPGGWLVSDNAGSRLAWFDFTQPEAPEIVVYNTQAGEVVASSEIVVPTGEIAYPFWIHDDAAFWMVEDPENGAFEDEPVPDMRLDLTTGVAAPISPEVYLAELSSGSPARTFRVSHAERGFKVAAISPGTGHQFDAARNGRLDPMGAQPIEIRDGLTDQQLGFRWPAGFTSNGPVWVVQWLADDRLVLWPEGGDQDALLECPVPTGTCEVAVTGPESLVVPFKS